MPSDMPAWTIASRSSTDWKTVFVVTVVRPSFSSKATVSIET